MLDEEDIKLLNFLAARELARCKKEYGEEDPETEAARKLFDKTDAICYIATGGRLGSLVGIFPKGTRPSIEEAVPRKETVSR